MTESGLSDFSHFCPADSLPYHTSSKSSDDTTTTINNNKSSVKLRSSKANTSSSSGSTWFARRMAKSHSVALTVTLDKDHDNYKKTTLFQKSTSPMLSRNSLPDATALLTDVHKRGGGGVDRNSSPIDVPMSHLISLQKELDVLKDCVTKHGGNSSSPNSSADDLSIFEEDFPKPRPPPLVVDEPFNILTPSTTENVIFPLEEYSVQVEPFYNSSYTLTGSDSSLNDSGGPRPSTPPTSNGLKRQGSFEYDHLEEISEEQENNRSTSPPISSSNSSYFVAVQFSEEENKDVKTSTLATLYDDGNPSSLRKNSIHNVLEEQPSFHPSTTTTTVTSLPPSTMGSFLSLQHGKPSPINAHSSRLSHSIPGRLNSPSLHTLSDVTSDHTQYWSSSMTTTQETPNDKCHCPSCCSCGSSLRKLSLESNGHQTSHEITPPPLGHSPPYSCPLQRYKTRSLKNSSKISSVSGISPLASSKIERVRSDGNRDKCDILRPATSSVPPTHVSISTPIVTTSQVEPEPSLDNIPVILPSSDPETQSLWSIPSHYSIQSSVTGGSVLPPCCDRIHVGYQNGLDVNVFKERMDVSL